MPRLTVVGIQDDVLANSFNLLRAFVFLHGRQAELKLVRNLHSTMSGFCSQPAPS